MLRHLINLLLFPLPPTRFFALRRWGLRRCGIRLGQDACVSGGGWIYGRGALSVGDRTWLSPGSRIYTHLDAPISIGSNCDIGPDVRLITGSHDIGNHDRRAGRGLALPISIGDGCWIGAGAMILGGVTIGPGSIVAAGAVVVDDIAPDTLSAGVPAIEKRILP